MRGRVKNVKIMIAGDLVPTETNQALFAAGDVEGLLGRTLKEKWEKSDLRIFNLEAPLVDEGQPIVKSGPNLKIKTDCVRGIQALNPTLVSAANNHIRDFGREGIESTKALLEKHGLSMIGAGDSPEEADACKIVKFGAGGGTSAGFYACAEHEFSLVSDYGSGANGFSEHQSLTAIEKLKREAGFVTVLYHGGKEHYPYPTPQQQKVCRSMVDAGADLVVCQHSHCVGCQENYHRGTIVYGQGNFIFDKPAAECWNTGLIVEITLEEKKTKDSAAGIVEIDYIPIEKSGNGIKEAEGVLRRDILGAFEARSREILSKEAVEEIFEKFSQNAGLDYLYICAGWNRILRGLDKRVFHRKLIQKYFKTEKRAMLLGLIQCETHRGIIEHYLRKSM